jgi:hypothetical protein
MSHLPNEKTLELNVISSLLDFVRQNGHPQAYAYGFTLSYEGRRGLDSSIELSPHFSMIAFQFKKVHSLNPPTFVFNFNNNKARNQHNLICDAARAAGSIRSIFYALPAFENTTDLATKSPNFLDDTYVIDPLDIGYINDGQPHEFVINVRNGTYAVHSDRPRKTGKTQSLKSLFMKFDDKTIGINVAKFQQNLQSISDEINSRSRSIPARINPKAIIV